MVIANTPNLNAIGAREISMKLAIIFFLAWITATLFGCQSNYAPWMVPKDGFYDSVDQLSLEESTTGYFRIIDANYDPHNAAYSIHHSTIYGAFPFYEKAQVGRVFNKLCTDRDGIVKGDKKTRLDPFVDFSSALFCENENPVNSGKLEVSHSNKTLYLKYTTEADIIANQKIQEDALEKERVKKEEERKNFLLAKEQKRKDCRKETLILQNNISEGDYTLQGLVVEVKDEVVLIQTQNNMKWYKKSSILSIQCAD